MNVRPLLDRIVVRRLEEGEQNIGGIIGPDILLGKYPGQEIKLGPRGRNVILDKKFGSPTMTRDQITHSPDSAVRPPACR